MKKPTKTSKPAKPATAKKAPAKKQPAKDRETVRKPAAAAKSKGAPAVKQAQSVVVETRIEALFDVGYGNTLFIRGEGPGLSWERGIALACVADDRWSIVLPDANRPVVCKFLVNDQNWSVGDDFVIMPGRSVTLVPVF